ncbi:hypothetical protein D3C72_1257550 [compost metagenome]
MVDRNPDQASLEDAIARDEELDGVCRQHGYLAARGQPASPQIVCELVGLCLELGIAQALVTIDQGDRLTIHARRARQVVSQRHAPNDAALLCIQVTGHSLSPRESPGRFFATGCIASA